VWSIPKTTPPRAYGRPVLEHVSSLDGTRIAYRRSGQGPPLVLLHAITGAHWSWTLLAPLLQDRFTVYAVDRCGRGESGDHTEYAIEREFEDVAALVDSIGEPASVFGYSYGGTVTLGAAVLTDNLHRVVLYEPSPGIQAVPAEDLDAIDALVARDEPEEALVFALRSLGLSPDEVDQMRDLPIWSERVAAAHTVTRELRAEEAYGVDPERFRDLSVPVLLLVGEKSPGWAHDGTDRIRAALPNSQVAILSGQGHAATVTAPHLVADEITRFLSV
jgi:pimeloyl-ACP methyl ester carboxylesterase